MFRLFGLLFRVHRRTVATDTSKSTPCLTVSQEVLSPLLSSRGKNEYLPVKGSFFTRERTRTRVYVCARVRVARG